MEGKGEKGSMVFYNTTPVKHFKKLENTPQDKEMSILIQQTHPPASHRKQRWHWKCFFWTMLFLSRFSLPFLKIYAITEYSLMVLDIFQDFQMQSCLHNNFGVVPLPPQEYTTIFSALTTYLIILKWTGTTCGRKEKKKKKRVILEVNILRILGSYR